MSRMLRRALVILSTIVGCASLFAQGTYYVDVHGNPPGTGAPNDPFVSIQYAHDHVGEFSTLLVAPGDYVENLDLTKRLTVSSMQGAQSTFLRPAQQSTCLTLTGVLDQADALVVEGFTITGLTMSATGAAAVKSMNGRLSRCIVTGNSVGFAILYDGIADDCTIAANGLNVDVEALGIFSGRNTIVWDGSSFVSLYAIVTSQYCAGDPQFAGFGGQVGDPLMWNSAAGDFHLKPGSPCIDAGDPASPPDPDGTRVDIGYFVYDSSYASAPTPYCTAKINSLGCVASIQFAGGASASSTNPFTIGAVSVLNNKSGLLFYGHAPDIKTFQGGWHCVKLPTKRTAVQNSSGNPPPNDCSGNYSIDFNARIQSGIDPSLVAGATIYAQYWSRDPGDAFQSGLTDALSFGIAP